MKTRRSFLAICLGALIPWRRAKAVEESIETVCSIVLDEATGLPVQTLVRRVNGGKWKEIYRGKMDPSIANQKVVEWTQFTTRCGEEFSSTVRHEWKEYSFPTALKA